MKQLLLFLCILFVCGSLKQKDELVCKNKIRVKYYLKGKIQHVTFSTFDRRWGGGVSQYVDISDNIKFNADSAVYDLIWQP